MASDIYIATPNMGWLCTPLAQAMPYWLKNFSTVWWAPQYMRPISYARNWCVDDFLRSDSKWFWLIDADTCPPLDALDKMLAADKMVVAAGVRVEKEDVDGIRKKVPMLMRADEDGMFYSAQGAGVEKIDRAGFGCVLFKREVFEILELPWFEERPWGPIRGTDFILCEKLERAGIPLYAHFEIACLHRKETDL